jgi:hypothetical protein
MIPPPGVINVSVENVQELMVAADMLQLAEVVSICGEFLQGHMEPSNCVGIFQFLEQIGCMDMLEFTENYIHVHFLEVLERTSVCERHTVYQSHKPRLKSCSGFPTQARSIEQVCLERPKVSLYCVAVDLCIYIYIYTVCIYIYIYIYIYASNRNYAQNVAYTRQ